MVTSSSNSNMKSPFFLLEKGVRPWEGSDRDPTIGNFSTLTIIGLNHEALFHILQTVFQHLKKSFHRPIRWHTIGQPLEGGSLQKETLKKQLKHPLVGFENPVLEIDSGTQIPCIGAILQWPLSIQHVESLLSSRYSILILAMQQDLPMNEVFLRLRPYLVGLDEGTIPLLASKNPDWVLGRCYENDIHCAWQFIGVEEHVQKIVEILSAQVIRRVGNKDDAAEAISLFPNQ